MRPTMAARVEGMVRPQRGAELLDGLVVVFLVGIFSGIGLAFVVRANQTIVPQVLRAATSAALGVLTGVTAARARAQAGATGTRPRVTRKRRTVVRRPPLRTRLTSWVSQRSVLARRGRRVRLVGAGGHRCPHCVGLG